MKKIPDDIKQMDERIRKLKAKEQRTREEKPNPSLPTLPKLASVSGQN